MTTRRRACALAASLLLLAGAVHLVGAQDPQLPLRVWLLRLPGTELGLYAADMDQDGARDLVIAHMRGLTGAERDVSVYLQGGKDERFAAAAQRRHQVPPDACAFAAGDFHPAPGGEVALLCPTRVLLLLADGSQHEVGGLNGFFDYPEYGALPAWDLVRDLDGDGRPELLAPTKDGYVVLSGSAEAPLLEVARLAVPPSIRFGPAFETVLLNRFLTASSRTRRPVAADVNGDGRQDLLVYRQKKLARYLQRADGTFPADPDREDAFALAESARDERKEGEEREDGLNNVRLALADVNADGLADLLVTRTLGDVGVFETLRTQQLVFVARRGPEGALWKEDAPDAVINLKGLSDDPVLVDWDGDGRLDLVLSTYRMDLFTNVKRAILDSMSIEYMIFRQREAGAPFPADPDFAHEVSVPLDVLQRRGGAKAVDLRADLDGDGIRDMIARGRDGGLSVLRGRVQRGLLGGETLGFDDSRPIRLAVGRAEPPWVLDLDGDGRDELILEPFAGEDLDARTVRVVGVAR